LATSPGTSFTITISSSVTLGAVLVFATFLTALLKSQDDGAYVAPSKETVAGDIELRREVADDHGNRRQVAGRDLDCFGFNNWSHPAAL
jgi:hypothetical protein